MAEGFARALKSMEVEADSAGVEIQGLNPNAVNVMAEAGALPDNLVQSKTTTS
jgi:arsenate reductase